MNGFSRFRQRGISAPQHPSDWKEPTAEQKPKKKYSGFSGFDYSCENGPSDEGTNNNGDEKTSVDCAAWSSDSDSSSSDSDVLDETRRRSSSFRSMVIGNRASGRHTMINSLFAKEKEAQNEENSLR